MNDEIKTTSPSKPLKTTTVVGRVEGVDPHGRPRLLRLFYPEDAYSPGTDRREHISIPFDAKDVARVTRQ